MASRQKLEAQKQENLGVQKVGKSTLGPHPRVSLTRTQEFGKLKDDESIYKMVGPVLLKQDKSEAESTVNGRLEFITTEMYVFFFAAPFKGLKLTPRPVRGLRSR